MKTWQTITNPDVIEDIELAIDETIERELVVFNDEVNTFDYVIETLTKVCKHTPEQAEQCTLLIHFKGKCTVKVGTWEFLKPMRDAICDRGISAEVF